MGCSLPGPVEGRDRHGAVRTLVLKVEPGCGRSEPLPLVRGGIWKGILFYSSCKEGRAQVSWGEKAG